MVFELNAGEKRILRLLYAAHKPLPTERVADASELSWATAKKYLLELQKKGLVTGGKYGKAVYWWLRT